MARRVVGAFLLAALLLAYSASSTPVDTGSPLDSPSDNTPSENTPGDNTPSDSSPHDKTPGDEAKSPADEEVPCGSNIDGECVAGAERDVEGTCTCTAEKLCHGGRCVEELGCEIKDTLFDVDVFVRSIDGTVEIMSPGDESSEKTGYVGEEECRGTKYRIKLVNHYANLSATVRRGNYVGFHSFFCFACKLAPCDPSSNPLCFGAQPYHLGCAQPAKGCAPTAHQTSSSVRGAVKCECPYGTACQKHRCVLPLDSHMNAGCWLRPMGGDDGEGKYEGIFHLDERHAAVTKIRNASLVEELAPVHFHYGTCADPGAHHTDVGVMRMSEGKMEARRTLAYEDFARARVGSAVMVHASGVPGAPGVLCCELEMWPNDPAPCSSEVVNYTSQPCRLGAVQTVYPDIGMMRCSCPEHEYCADGVCQQSEVRVCVLRDENATLGALYTTSQGTDGMDGMLPGMTQGTTLVSQRGLCETGGDVLFEEEVGATRVVSESLLDYYAEGPVGMYQPGAHVVSPRRVVGTVPAIGGSVVARVGNASYACCIWETLEKQLTEETCSVDFVPDIGQTCRGNLTRGPMWAPDEGNPALLERLVRCECNGTAQACVGGVCTTRYRCPDSGFSRDVEKHRCYGLVGVETDWLSAFRRCAENGGSLAGREDMSFAGDMATAPLWVGVRKANGKWTWVDRLQGPLPPPQPPLEVDESEGGECAVVKQDGTLMSRRCELPAIPLCVVSYVPVSSRVLMVNGTTHLALPQHRSASLIFTFDHYPYDEIFFVLADSKSCQTSSPSPLYTPIVDGAALLPSEATGEAGVYYLCTTDRRGGDLSPTDVVFEVTDAGVLGVNGTQRVVVSRFEEVVLAPYGPGVGDGVPTTGKLVRDGDSCDGVGVGDLLHNVGNVFTVQYLHTGASGVFQLCVQFVTGSPFEATPVRIEVEEEVVYSWGYPEKTMGLLIDVPQYSAEVIALNATGVHAGMFLILRDSLDCEQLTSNSSIGSAMMISSVGNSSLTVSTSEHTTKRVIFTTSPRYVCLGVPTSHAVKYVATPLLFAVWGFDADSVNGSKSLTVHQMYQGPIDLGGRFERVLGHFHLYMVYGECMEFLDDVRKLMGMFVKNATHVTAIVPSAATVQVGVHRLCVRAYEYSEYYQDLGLSINVVAWKLRQVGTCTRGDANCTVRGTNVAVVMEGDNLKEGDVIQLGFAKDASCKDVSPHIHGWISGAGGKPRLTYVADDEDTGLFHLCIGTDPTGFLVAVEALQGDFVVTSIGADGKGIDVPLGFVGEVPMEWSGQLGEVGYAADCASGSVTALPVVGVRRTIQVTFSTLLTPQEQIVCTRDHSSMEWSPTAFPVRVSPVTFRSVSVVGREGVQSNILVVYRNDHLITAKADVHLQRPGLIRYAANCSDGGPPMTSITAEGRFMVDIASLPQNESLICLGFKDGTFYPTGATVVIKEEEVPVLSWIGEEGRHMAVVYQGTTVDIPVGGEGLAGSTVTVCSNQSKGEEYPVFAAVDELRIMVGMPLTLHLGTYPLCVRGVETNCSLVVAPSEVRRLGGIQAPGTIEVFQRHEKAVLVEGYGITPFLQFALGDEKCSNITAELLAESTSRGPDGGMVVHVPITTALGDFTLCTRFPGGGYRPQNFTVTFMKPYLESLNGTKSLGIPAGYDGVLIVQGRGLLQDTVGFGAVCADYAFTARLEQVSFTGDRAMLRVRVPQSATLIGNTLNACLLLPTSAEMQEVSVGISSPPLAVTSLNHNTTLILPPLCDKCAPYIISVEGGGLFDGLELRFASQCSVSSPGDLDPVPVRNVSADTSRGWLAMGSKQWRIISAADAYMVCIPDGNGVWADTGLRYHTVPYHYVSLDAIEGSAKVIIPHGYSKGLRVSGVHLSTENAVHIARSTAGRFECPYVPWNDTSPSQLSEWMAADFSKAELKVASFTFQPPWVVYSLSPDTEEEAAAIFAKAPYLPTVEEGLGTVFGRGGLAKVETSFPPQLGRCGESPQEPVARLERSAEGLVVPSDGLLSSKGDVVSAAVCFRPEEGKGWRAAKGLSLTVAEVTGLVLPPDAAEGSLGWLGVNGTGLHGSWLRFVRGDKCSEEAVTITRQQIVCNHHRTLSLPCTVQLDGLAAVSDAKGCIQTPSIPSWEPIAPRLTIPVAAITALDGHTSLIVHPGDSRMVAVQGRGVHPGNAVMLGNGGCADVSYKYTIDVRSRIVLNIPTEGQGVSGVAQWVVCLSNQFGVRESTLVVRQVAGESIVTGVSGSTSVDLTQGVPSLLSLDSEVEIEGRLVFLSETGDCAQNRSVGMTTVVDGKALLTPANEGQPVLCIQTSLRSFTFLPQRGVTILVSSATFAFSCPPPTTYETCSTVQREQRLVVYEGFHWFFNVVGADTTRKPRIRWGKGCDTEPYNGDEYRVASSGHVQIGERITAERCAEGCPVCVAYEGEGYSSTGVVLGVARVSDIFVNDELEVTVVERTVDAIALSGNGVSMITNLYFTNETCDKATGPGLRVVDTSAVLQPPLTDTVTATPLVMCISVDEGKTYSSTKVTLSIVDIVITSIGWQNGGGALTIYKNSVTRLSVVVESSVKRQLHFALRSTCSDGRNHTELGDSELYITPPAIERIPIGTTWPICFSVDRHVWTFSNFSVSIEAAQQAFHDINGVPPGGELVLRCGDGREENLLLRVNATGLVSGEVLLAEECNPKVGTSGGMVFIVRPVYNGRAHLLLRDVEWPRHDLRICYKQQFARVFTDSGVKAQIESAVISSFSPAAVDQFTSADIVVTSADKGSLYPGLLIKLVPYEEGCNATAPHFKLLVFNSIYHFVLTTNSTQRAGRFRGCVSWLPSPDDHWHDTLQGIVVHEAALTELGGKKSGPIEVYEGMRTALPVEGEGTEHMKVIFTEGECKEISADDNRALTVTLGKIPLPLAVVQHPAGQLRVCLMRYGGLEWEETSWTFQVVPAVITGFIVDDVSTTSLSVAVGMVKEVMVVGKGELSLFEVRFSADCSKADSDPVQGATRPLSISPKKTIALTSPYTAEKGHYDVCLRLRETDNKWRKQEGIQFVVRGSPLESYLLLTVSSPSPNLPEIVRAVKKITQVVFERVAAKKESSSSEQSTVRVAFLVFELSRQEELITKFYRTVQTDREAADTMRHLNVTRIEPYSYNGSRMAEAIEVGTVPPPDLSRTRDDDGWKVHYALFAAAGGLLLAVLIGCLCYHKRSIRNCCCRRKPYASAGDEEMGRRDGGDASQVPGST